MIKLSKFKIDSFKIRYLIIIILLVILIILVYRINSQILENSSIVKSDYHIVENYSDMDIDLEYEKHEIMKLLNTFNNKIIDKEIPNSFINNFNPNKNFNYNLNIIEIEKPSLDEEYESYINLEISGDLNENLDFFEDIESQYINLSIDTFEINKEVFGENYYRFNTRLAISNIGENSE